MNQTNIITIPEKYHNSFLVELTLLQKKDKTLIMNNTIEINQGEILIKLESPKSGKLTFEELGLKNEDLNLESGLLRLVIDLEDIGEHHYYKVPTIEVFYKEKVAETHWQCDFNEETILDKTDHYGNSTVILLDRNKLSSLEHHHQNKLILHAEFPKPVHLVADKSFITFFN